MFKLIIEAIKQAVKNSKELRSRLKIIKTYEQIEKAVIYMLIIFIFLAFFYGLYSLGKTICGIPFAEKFNKDLKAMCEIVDEIDAEMNKNIVVLPYPNKEIKSVGERIQEKRNDKIDALDGGAQKYEEKSTHLAEEGTINEAEMHLRILMDVDSMVINDSTIKEEDIKNGKYAGSNLEKIYKISQKMKTEGKYRNMQEKAEKGKWSFREWMVYAQSQVYQCYLLGDGTGHGWFWQNKDDPCEELDDLYQKTFPDENGEYVLDDKTVKVEGKNVTEHGDRGVVHQTKTEFKYVKECKPIPKEEPPSEPSDPISPEPPPRVGGPIPFFSLISILNELFNNNVYAKGSDTVFPAAPCAAGTEEVGENVIKSETMTYIQIREILDDFEKYSLYENGQPFIPEDETYENELKDKIHFVYKEMYDTDIGSIIGGDILNGWMIPVPNGTYYMSSGFGCRWIDDRNDPLCAGVPNTNDFHQGTDFAGVGGRNIGTPIYAMKSGVVIYANPDKNSPVGKVQSSAMDESASGYGGLVIIRHNNGYLTSYGHMKRSDILVQPGWQVNQGQVISAVGNEGASFGAHLHMTMCTDQGEAIAMCGWKNYDSFAIDPQKEPINLVFNKDTSKISVATIQQQQQNFINLKQKIKSYNGKDLEHYVMQLGSGLKTKMDISLFIVDAQNSQQASGIPASVTLAQCILESGGSNPGGLSGLAYNAKNLFGIKGEGPAGYVLMPTKEFENGEYITVNAKFRKYDTYTQSMMDHADFLSGPRYAAKLKDARTPQEYVEGIKAAGYATDPEYVNKLMDVINDNNLTRYDLEDTTYKQVSVPWDE